MTVSGQEILDMADRAAGPPRTLPPAREPSVEQLSKIPERREGHMRLGPGPQTPTLGNRSGRPKPRILLVDDEETFIDNTRAVWSATDYRDHADFDFFLYKDARRAELVALLKQSFDDRRPFDTVYIDMNLKEGGAGAGIGVMERLRHEVKELRYIPFVAITSFPDPVRERAARERGAIRLIIKTSEKSASDILGNLVYRMIFEAQETLEQVEDQFWADAASELSGYLRDQGWQRACQHVLDFIHVYFAVKALYARRLHKPNILVDIAAKNHLEIEERELSVAKVPYLRRFIDSVDQEPYQIIQNIPADEVGQRLADNVRDHHAVLARIGVAKQTFGLLTMYRHPQERPFRKRDAEGLARLASLLAGAIAQEELSRASERETERLRQRQRTLLRQIREFDSAPNEIAIWERLRDALSDAFRSPENDAQQDLMVTVFQIDPGTNKATRPCAPNGVFPKGHNQPVLLENVVGSSVARTIWHGKSERYDDLVFDRDRDTFLFRHPKTKSSLTVPAIVQDMCVGAANLESLRPHEFSEVDQEFVEVLAESAAAAIHRLRARKLLEEMTRVSVSLAGPEGLAANVLVNRVLRLLFDFTGCSEVLYWVPPIDEQSDTKWTVRSIFQRHAAGDVVELSGTDAEAWRHYFSEGWERTFVYRVLSSGKKVDWSEQFDENIGLTEEGLPGRSANQNTRTQVVIVVRDNGNFEPEAVIAISIQQRNAMSKVRAGLLELLGSFVASLLLHQRQISRILGLATIHEQEARLGQMFSQIRHGLRSKLALIRQNIVLAENGYSEWPAVAKEVKNLLTEIDRETDRNRSMIKVPKLEQIDVGKLWNSVREELSPIAAEKNSQIVEHPGESELVTTDPDILRTILFNLADNALRHGGSNVVVSATTRSVGGKTKIQIRDTGRGFAASIRDSLFQPMTTTTPDSTGLGLYLSRLRAKDLGGDLELVSSDGSGSCFEVILPEHPR
jgi:signal transduction histidine kinase/GAF domain-containing protein/CheY-like chemotaxis protein